MPADLKQNIFYMVYFVVIHNFLAILFSLGIIVSAFLTFYQPTRAKLCVLFGFIILLFAFQYNKHIVEPLRQQTTNSLITIQEHNKVRRAIDLSLTKAIPFGLPVLGIGFIGLGVVLALRNRKLKN